MRIPVAGWVAPFGDPGINDRSHLPRAFRSVPRPSSPLSAKASTRCPCFARSKTIGAAVASHPNTPDNRRAQGQAPFWQRPQFGRAPNLAGLPFDKGFPLPGFPRRRGVFHEDTSSDGPHASCHPHLGAVRLGHIHKFALPVQSTPPRTPGRRRGTHPARLTRPRNKPGLLRMSFIRDQMIRYQ
jgi:hypothetical protein